MDNRHRTHNKIDRLATTNTAPPTSRHLTLALLALAVIALALFGARANEAAEHAKVWVGRRADVSGRLGTAPDFLAYSGGELIPVTVAGNAAAAASEGDGVLLAWPTGSGSPRPLVAFDPGESRLHLLDPASGAFYHGNLDGGDLQPAGELAEAAGARALAIDGSSGTIFLLDSDGSRVLRVRTGAMASGSARVAVDLTRLGVAPADLLALDPSNGHLYLLSWEQTRLYEVTTSGELQASHALPGQAPTSAHSMVFAPSQDLTDEPETQSLYVLGDSVTYEWWSQNSLLTVAEEATLIQMTDTSAYLPPSPDPAGLTYWSSQNRLVISDSEVNEMPIFEDANIFVVTLGGTLTGRSDIRPVTREPTDVAFNPLNGHFFYSDDDADKIFQVSRQPDSDAGIDDIVAELDTRLFGSRDPEGIAFDPNGPTGPRLFVVDGSSRHVYEIRAGEDGSFTDESITVIGTDVGDHGIVDPEGIEYDSASGNLFVLDSYVDPDGKAFIYELTTGGDFVNTIDISVAEPVMPAGITLAPGSDNNSLTSFYIVDRGVDNNVDPDENDGRLYELRVVAEPPPEPTPTNTVETPAPPPPAPTVSPTATAPPSVDPPTPTPTATRATPSPTPHPPGSRLIYSPLVARPLHGPHGEPNDSCQQAYPLSLNVARSFLPEDPVDWYRFTTPAQGTVRVHLSEFAPEAGQVAVYRGPSCDNREYLRNFGNPGTVKIVDLGVQPAATFYVYVSNDGVFMTQPYRLEIVFQPTTP
jgi:hypothetical protein